MNAMAWIVVGETLRERFAKLEGSMSIREVDVHGTFEIAFLLLLTLPSVPPPKDSTSPRLFGPAPHKLWRLSSNPRPANRH